MIRDDQGVAGNARTPILWLGTVMIFIGIGLLIYLGMSVIQVLEDPTRAELVRMVLSSIQNNGMLVSGEINNKTFVIKGSDGLQYFFLGILGLMMISILVRIVISVISGGVNLVMSTQPKVMPQPEHQSDASNQ